MEIEIILDGVMEDISTFNKDIKLNEIREQINLEKDFLFLNKDNIPIKKNLEKKLNLEKILKDSKIYLKSYSEDITSSKTDLKINEPIKGSKEKLDGEKIKYYQYPKIEFTSEEDDKSKVILLVGKTGDGKSTFINALVNIYMGVKIEDKFRYLLINEDTSNQTKSVTKDITICNIRAKKGFNYPPLKVVDTPGFGDTEGIEEDQKHINLFQNVFENQLLSVNCICFIVKGADTRVDFHQNYVFNCIMNLFAENVKDNFIVGVTNFIPYKKNDLPNIIASCLSRENSFYYQNILKKDNLNREEILKTDWFFACDNKIIFDDDIDKDDYDEKKNYEKTENKIKIFIEKIKKLDSKPIKESSNVIRKRLEMQNEINALTEKLENLNEDKKRCEYNKKELTNYLLDIKKQESIVFELEKEKSNHIEFINNIKEVNETLKKEIKRNSNDKEEKLKKYRQMNNKIKILKNEFNKKIKRKKKVIKKIYKNYSNIVCLECQTNCHVECQCSLTGLFKYFCSQIDFFGNCKICKHGISKHEKCQYVFKEFYEEIEENKTLIKSMNEELRKVNRTITQLKEEEECLTQRNAKLELDQSKTDIQLIELLNKKEEESNYINYLEDFIKKLNIEKNIVINKIEKYKEKIKKKEVEIIQILNKIKINLDYLRKKSLNKEFNRTMESYIDEKIKIAENMGDNDEKNYLVNLKKIYMQLIEIENIDISELTINKYEEVKNKINSNIY